MSLNRRELLRLGAAGAGGLLVSTAASSVPLPMGILTAPPVKLDPLAPAPAAPVAPAGINPTLFQKAKAALDSRPWIRNRDYVGIVDFSLASHEGRFHVVTLVEGGPAMIEYATVGLHNLAYAETLAIPAAVGAYRVHNRGRARLRIVKSVVSAT